MIDKPTEAVIRVARALADMADEVVFVGGSAVPFMLPASHPYPARATEDVDCVVPAETTLQYYTIAGRLRALGFRECSERGSPICRWLIEDLTVDIMPTGSVALGFNNRWYREVLRAPTEVEFDDNRLLRVANPAVFLATKFEAFTDRGGGQPLGDTDIEDIITVLAYRKDRAELALYQPPELRAYLAAEARKLLEQPNLLEIISACLPSDKNSQGLVAPILQALRSLGQLT